MARALPPGLDPQVVAAEPAGEEVVTSCVILAFVGSACLLVGPSAFALAGSASADPLVSMGFAALRGEQGTRVLGEPGMERRQVK